MVFRVTHPHPKPDSDPEKGFVLGMGGKSGACVPGGDTSVVVGEIMLRVQEVLFWSALWSMVSSWEVVDKG